jgi:hypothetical protein
MMLNIHLTLTCRACALRNTAHNLNDETDDDEPLSNLIPKHKSSKSSDHDETDDDEPLSNLIPKSN